MVLLADRSLFTVARPCGTLTRFPFSPAVTGEHLGTTILAQVRRRFQRTSTDAHSNASAGIHSESKSLAGLSARAGVRPYRASFKYLYLNVQLYVSPGFTENSTNGSTDMTARIDHNISRARGRSAVTSTPPPVFVSTIRIS